MQNICNSPVIPQYWVVKALQTYQSLRVLLAFLYQAVLQLTQLKYLFNLHTVNQCCGGEIIFFGSGSGSTFVQNYGSGYSHILPLKGTVSRDF